MLSAEAKKKLDHFRPLNAVLDYTIPRLALHYPFKLAYYYLFKTMVYRRTQKGKIKRVPTFFGEPMHIMLPASLDIFFFGLKSHPSEIALSKFMVSQLGYGDVVIDIGAHFGYYTLLASKLVGPQGQVVAVEASPETFRILALNAGHMTNVAAKNLAISETPGGQISFFVYPVYYSELNTLNPDQYQSSAWFKKVKAKKVEVSTTTLSRLVQEQSRPPKLIKIDVEGAEDRVIKGALEALQVLDDTSLIMEYIHDEKKQQPYIDAENLLRGINYHPHYIRIDGSLQDCGASVLSFMKEHRLWSENIVFLKK